MQAPLKVALVDLLDGSSALPKRDAGSLPRFTFHDTTHLANVLYWMDQFVTPQGLAALGPVGCGL